MPKRPPWVRDLDEPRDPHENNFRLLDALWVAGGLVAFGVVAYHYVSSQLGSLL